MQKLKWSILSLSLITVMVNYPISPALGEIAKYYPSISPTTIKLILTLPSLFIIISSLLFTFLSLSTRTIALVALSLYLISGIAPIFINNFFLLLTCRALIGIAVGLLIPLAVGLLSYHFDESARPKLIGLASAINNIGGISAIILSGLLINYLGWKYLFLIYLFGIPGLILIYKYLPHAKISSKKSKLSWSNIKTITYSIFSIFLAMLILYVFPSNFAIMIRQQNLLNLVYLGPVMMLANLTAFLTGIFLTMILKTFGKFARLFGVMVFALGFILLTTSTTIIIILGVILIGLGIGILIPLLNIKITSLLPKEKVPSAMSLVGAAIYLGQFVSPLLVDTMQKYLLVSHFFIAAIMTIFLISWTELFE